MVVIFKSHIKVRINIKATSIFKVIIETSLYESRNGALGKLA